MPKLVNIILVYIGYWLSVLFKRVFVLGYPYAVSIETSSVCNLCCPECYTGEGTLNRKAGLMPYDDFTQIIGQIKKHTIYLNLSLQGEPFLNPDLSEMIHYANQQKLFTSLSTNGHFLDAITSEKIIQSGLRKLIISVDGTNQEVYEKYRKGGNLTKVLDGIKILSEIKRRKQINYPEIVIQFIVFKHNEHQINEIKLLGKELGADKVEIKSAQINNPEGFNDLIPTNDKYSRYTNTTHTLKSNLPNRCFRIWETLVITWDKIVVPCCFDKHAVFSLGNAQNEDLYSIWKSLVFNNFRKKILTHRKKVFICCNCTEGLRIKY